MSSTSTAIQWTDRTWNPVRGCSRVSPGCDNCYAMKVAHRFSGEGRPYEGLTTLRRGKVDWSGVARFVPSALDEPLHWRKPARIFVNSMSDLFHHSVTNEEIAAVFGVMAASPQHTFQVLTKRAERMREWFEWANRDAPIHPAQDACIHAAERVIGRSISPVLPPWPLPNVWLGVSAEDQQRAEERIPHLLATPAAVRFVSAEPLLGPIVFNHRHLGQDSDCPECGRHVGVDEDGCCSGCGEDALYYGLDWVIVGGESGPGARPCALEWVESVVEQCREAEAACFVKQLGAVVVSEQRTATAEEFEAITGRKPQSGLAPNGEHWAWRAGLTDRKGGDPSEWPDDLRVREFPPSEGEK